MNSDEMSEVEYQEFEQGWSEYIDSKSVVRRRDGMAYLMRHGDSYVPCSRYGRRSIDCAEVAWRFTYVLARETGEPITAATLEHSMGMVVNDHDDVASIIREHGHRMYR